MLSFVLFLLWESYCSLCFVFVVGVVLLSFVVFVVGVVLLSFFVFVVGVVLLSFFVFVVGVVLLFFSFLCCVLCYVCLRIVSCAIHVASVSGLSILDRSFGFL